MRLSVAIPVFNAARYLRECLDSLLAQSMRDMEIICVDDGSTDESGAILSEYAKRDGRIRLVTQQNAGQGAARNRGLEIAHGEYVYFMDADDELAAPDALERLVAVAGADRLDVVLFDAETRVDEGLTVSSAIVRADGYIRRRDYSSIREGRALLAQLVKNNEYTVSPYLALYRRSFLSAAAIRFPSEPIFYEDNIFMTRVMLAAKRASHRPWRLYLRKVHENSTVTSKPTMRHLLGYLACYRDACDLLARGGWDRATRNALRARQRIYKLNVRRLAEQVEVDADAARELAPILRYPLHEKMANAFHCLSERGLRFTIRRIFLGRQP